VTVPWQGSFTPENITGLIEALCLESSAGRLTFRSGTQMGSLYLLEGRLVDAHYKSLTGIDGLAVLLGFEAGEYRFVSGLRSEHPNLNGELADLIRQAKASQRQTPVAVQQAIPSPSAPSPSVTNPVATPPVVSRNPTSPDVSYLPANFFEEARVLLNDLRVTQPGVVLARAMVGLGDDLGSIPKARVMDFVRNIENEINPGQARMFKQSILMTVDALESKIPTQINAPIAPIINPEPRIPTTGLRTVAATMLGRIPGPILSSLFISEVRQTLEQLRVFNAETAIDRAAENLGFYPFEIPSSQTKKFLTAIISEITNEQGYQFQQLLDTTVKELETQNKTNKTTILPDRNPLGGFVNPLARAKPSSAKQVDPGLEFVQSLQQNLKNLVAANSVHGLIQAAATDLGIQPTNIAPGYAHKFVQAISQRLDIETAQKFQRTMALSVGAYTAQR
jgi:hypothetical protein